MAVVVDSFDRADSNSLGSNWSEDDGAWAISSNELRQTNSTGVYRKCRWVGSALASSNYAVEAVIRTGDGNIGGGVFGRGATSATVTYYGLVLFPTYGSYLVEITAGSESIIASYTTSPPGTGVDTTLRLEVDGSGLTGYVNGTSRLTATDSTLTSGAVGVMCYGGQNQTTTAYADDWTAYDLSAGSTYNLAANAAVATSTPTDSAMPVARSLTANSATATSTPAAALGVTRPMAANAATATSTPDATLDVAEGQTYNLAASAAVSTTTPAATMGVAFALTASAATATQTDGGNGWLRFNGNGADVNRVRIPLDNPSDPAIDVGASDFTYEFWARMAYADNATTATDEDARYSNIILDRDIWGHPRGWVFGVTRNGATLVTCFGQATAAGTWPTIFGTADVGDNVWHHFAISRSGTTLRVFVDGVQDASGTYGDDLSYPNGETGGGGQDNPYLVIGCEKHDVGFYYTGDFDEFRVSNNARYTTGFTPARIATQDANAVAIFHADEGTGGVLTDALGGVNGEILYGGSPAGPEWVAGYGGRMAVQRAVQGTTAAATSTPDAALTVVGVVTLVAGVAAVSTTLAASMSTSRALAATIDTTTATPAGSLAVQRPIVGTLNGAAVTASSALGVSRQLNGAFVVTTTTAAALATIARSVSAASYGSTVTPDALLNISGFVSLLASLAASTVTPGAQLSVNRTILGATHVSTATPDANLSISGFVSLLASVATTTNAPSAALSLYKQFTSALNGVTITPDATIAVQRAMLASAAVGTATPVAQAAISRSLNAALFAATTTPDSLLSISGFVSLLANLSATTSTQDASIAVLRKLATTASAQTNTLGAELLTTLMFAANLAAATSTPFAILSVLRRSAVTLSATTVAPGANLSISGLVTFAASLGATAQTSDSQLAVFRRLTAVIYGATAANNAALNRGITLIAAPAGATTANNALMPVARSIVASSPSETVTTAAILSAWRVLTAAADMSTQTAAAALMLAAIQGFVRVSITVFAPSVAASSLVPRAMAVESQPSIVVTGG